MYGTERLAICSLLLDLNKRTYFYESVYIDKRILTELQKLIVCVHQVNPFSTKLQKRLIFRYIPKYKTY